MPDAGDRTSRSKQTIEIVEPIGKRVLIRKDEDRKITKVGIHLPDKIEIPTLTGRVVAISAQIAANQAQIASQDVATRAQILRDNASQETEE